MIVNSSSIPSPSGEKGSGDIVTLPFEGRSEKKSEFWNPGVLPDSPTDIHQLFGSLDVSVIRYFSTDLESMSDQFSLYCNESITDSV